MSNLPFHIAERELAHLGRAHGWPEDTLLPRTVKRGQGPGNCVLLTMAFEHVAEVAIRLRPDGRRRRDGRG